MGKARLAGRPGTLIVPAAVFLLVAGIGAATSYLGAPSEAIGSADPIQTRSRLLGRKAKCLRASRTTRGLLDRRAGVQRPQLAETLPDVNTMIERLAARLETSPEDLDGWRMLGWSYFHTGHFEQAATAYAKAVELDPGFRRAQALIARGQGEGIRRRAAQAAGASLQPDAVAKATALWRPRRRRRSERDAAIRSMVDGLARSTRALAAQMSRAGRA